MSLKSTSSHYGSVAIAIHWTSAAAIVFTFAAGLAAANIEDPARVAPVLFTHVGLGLLVLVLTLLRIVWWLAADRHPTPLPNQPAWQMALASIVHTTIYVAILLMASSGIATLALSGAVPQLLSGAPLPDLSQLPPRIAHGIMSRLLLALLVVHIAAAVYHQWVRGDRLLSRMGIGA
jgi:cytochrome b561